MALHAVGLCARTDIPDPVQTVIEDSNAKVTGAACMSGRARRGRTVAMLLTSRHEGSLVKFAPKGTGLEQEWKNLCRAREMLGHLVPAPRSYEATVAEETFVSCLVPAARSWALRDDVQLCHIVRTLRSAGLTHGDLTPWNVLLDAWDRPRLIDWESSVPLVDEGADLAHFLLQAGSHLGWYSPTEILSLMTGPSQSENTWLLAAGIQPSVLTNSILGELSNIGSNEPRAAAVFKEELKQRWADAF
jgi:hypothetical protein